MRAHNSYFRQKKRSKKGLALSTVMAICIVLSILVALLVSMASLNINTTQATVSQREAYIQAKSALAFAESYYNKNGKQIPGAGDTGEGLVVFNTHRIADGAKFFVIKAGTKELLDADAVNAYKEACPDTYIEVTNARTTKGESILTLTAFSKYGGSNAYTLSKEFTIGGNSEARDNPVTISYASSTKTRYVRFHVRATSAMGGAPFFYMWYNQVSPAEGKSGYNAYATSSINNKLTWNHAFGKVINGNWGDNGPEASCAMSYEGNGWYVTQKTFNVERNVNFVNGIITKTGSTRSQGDSGQSWEFFGIPVPTNDQLGEGAGVDVYFELNQNRLLDMGGNQHTGDDFTNKYRSFYSDGDGMSQLNEFVKFCGNWYTIYTKKDTCIVHYREAGKTDASASPAGFDYEGYGWWRSATDDINGSVSAPNGASYSYLSSGRLVSRNRNFDKERVYEMYVCYDPDKNESAAFAYEEDANRWFIDHGDLSAGDYVEINARASGQPVDAQVETKIEYEADLYEQTEPVPVYDPSNFTKTAAPEEELKATDLDGKDEELKFQDLANDSYGGYYLVGTMNGGLDGTFENTQWSKLDAKYKLEKDGDGSIYYIDVDATANQDMSFWIVQRPDNLYADPNGYYKFTRVYDMCARYANTAAYEKISRRNYQRVEYTNYWGGSAENDYLVTIRPLSDKVRIYFDSEYGTVSDWSDIGEVSDDNKIYSVVGWMNQWGTAKSASGEQKSEEGLYEYTQDMQLYSDVDGEMSYLQGNLKIRTGESLTFKIAERDPTSTETKIQWDHVYGENGIVTNGADDEGSVLIQPVDNDGESHTYIISIFFDPKTKKPRYELTEYDELESFYVVGEFNGWSDEVKEDFEFANITDYEMEEVKADNNKISFSYRLKSLQEISDEDAYKVRVVSSFAETEDGKIDYDQTWGDKISYDTEDENYLVTKGGNAPNASYGLPERAYVTINFTYFKNDPTKSEITFSMIPYEEDENVASVYVGFHNGKLTDVNKKKQDSKFEEKWEKVYVTYYTELTGFSCFEARMADDEVNYWAKIPADAEYFYFSNRKTSVYSERKQDDYEYTENVLNAKFKDSTSKIFFPIIPNKDKDEKTYWTMGDSQLYNEYVNKVTHVSKVGDEAEQMAYYGSTQCNYYDAPFVNVLNMLVEGVPKPGQRYAFSAYPWPNYNNTPAGSISFTGADTVSYQGEEYYYVAVDGDSSFMIINNSSDTGGGKNSGSMWGILYEDQMSLELNSYTGTTRGYSTDTVSDGMHYDSIYNNLGSYLYAQNRAGGAFVSDEKYANGKDSLFNYGGYTPNWYTFRIPVSSEVTIKQITGITSSGAAMFSSTNNTPFKVAPQSENVNRPVYIFKDEENRIRTYTYNMNQGVVDSFPKYDGSGNLTGITLTSVYYDNSEGWSNVSVCAYSPLKAPQYFAVTDDPTTSDNNYLRFQFDEGEYCFFQFYDSSDLSADGLDNAEHKTPILYFTGEEFVTSEDYNKWEYQGTDDRATKVLAVGSAEDGLTYYIHPRTVVMRAYLDVDSIVQMMKETKYFGYNKERGVYNCHESVDMDSLSSYVKSYRDDYEKGNNGDGVWTVAGVQDVGAGILKSGSEFLDTINEARIFVADDITQCPDGETDWLGTDPDQCMVFLEGEQLKNSAFTYTPRWKNRLKNAYKKMMLSSYWTLKDDGTKDSYVRSNPNCVWTNTSKQNPATFDAYTEELRAFLDNPQYVIKPEAVRIIVDDHPTLMDDGSTSIPWGKSQIHLYIKEPGQESTWKEFTGADYCDTNTSGYYAYVFMWPSTVEQYNEETGKMETVANPLLGSQFAVAKKCPDSAGCVDGVPVVTQTVTAGDEFRYYTCYPTNDTSYDDVRFVHDMAVEAKNYNGTKIVESDLATNFMSQIIGSKVGRPFVANFKYDTTVQGGGVTYTIYAGAYEINAVTYPGFYSDFGGSGESDSTVSGIDLFTQGAKDFFTKPSTYGMVSAKSYTTWTSDRKGSKKPIDLMIDADGIAEGNLVASAPAETVSFRYCGVKDSEVLKMKNHNITLSGDTVRVAATTIDFRGSGSSDDFFLDSKTIEFYSNTQIILSSGETVTIPHGVYIFNDQDESIKYKKVSLKSSKEDGNDWRLNYTQVVQNGNDLKEGRFIAN